MWLVFTSDRVFIRGNEALVSWLGDIASFEPVKRVTRLLLARRHHANSTVIASTAVAASAKSRLRRRKGKTAGPEHRRLSRYSTMSLDEITKFPVSQIAAETAHLYLWIFRMPYYSRASLS